MFDVYEELRAITRALEQAGVRYAVVGGLAVSIYATPRATEDIDLLVDPASFDTLARVLEPLGYREYSDAMDFPGGLTIRRLTRLGPDDHMVLDLLMGDAPLYRDMLHRRVAAAMAEEKLWLAPVDGLCALKRMRGSPQDKADLAALGVPPEEGDA